MSSVLRGAGLQRVPRALRVLGTLAFCHIAFGPGVFAQGIHQVAESEAGVGR